MSDPSLTALPPGAYSALLAGNRRLAIALVRQATGLPQEDAADLVARHLAQSPALAAPSVRLDRTTLWWAALAGVLAGAVYLLLKQG